MSRIYGKVELHIAKIEFSSVGSFRYLPVCFSTFTYLLSFLTLTVSTIVVSAALLKPDRKATHPPTAVLDHGIIAIGKSAKGPAPSPGACGTSFPLSLQECRTDIYLPADTVSMHVKCKYYKICSYFWHTGRPYRIMVLEVAWWKSFADSTASLRHDEKGSSRYNAI